jgi:hypothetical protein
MTMYKSSDIGYLLAGPWNLTSISTKLEVGASNPVVETTPFGVTAATFGQPGVKKYEITGHDSFYDDAYYTAASEMVALSAGEHVIMFAHKGNMAGLTAICAGGVLYAGWKNSQAVGDYHKAAMELGVSGVIDNATIVASLTSRTGDTTTEASYIDLGATGGGTTGGNAYMSCTALALTGSTNVIITMEDSADHAAWADHTVFTALTAVGAEYKAATDLTVNRYLAYKQVFTGLAGTPTCTATVAFKVHAPH